MKDRAISMMHRSLVHKLLPLLVVAALLLSGCAPTLVKSDERFMLGKDAVVVSRTGERLQAAGVRAEGDMLTLTEPYTGEALQVPVAAVDFVAVQGPGEGLVHGMSKGFEAGAWAGGGLGVLAGLSLVSECGGACLVLVPLLSAVTFGFYGSVIGGFIGLLGGQGEVFRFESRVPLVASVDSSDTADDTVSGPPVKPGVAWSPVSDSLLHSYARKSDSAWVARNVGRMYKVGDFGLVSASGIHDPEGRHDGGGVAGSFGLGRVNGPGILLGGRVSARYHERTDYIHHPVHFTWDETFQKRVNIEPQVELSKFYPRSGHLWRGAVGAAYYEHTRGGTDPGSESSFGLSASIGYSYVLKPSEATRVTLNWKYSGMYYYDGSSATSWQATVGFLHF